MTSAVVAPLTVCADNGYPLPSDDITIDIFEEDARAAISWLRQREEVDDSSVSIIGHSQGAQFVTSILADDPTLKSGVMMAGPHSSIDRDHRVPAGPGR